MTIAVIGAGPAGLAAALQSSWHGASVVLFEGNPAPGRKLLVTGSGRCNITNDGVSADRYTCDDLLWLQKLLESFGVQNLLEMLGEIGVPVKKTSDGWYYPLSNSAQTVVDAFRSALDLAGVDFRPSSRVVGLAAGNDRLRISLEGGGSANFSRVILAAGGMAYPALGSTGELFPALAALGHKVIPLRPALAPLVLNLKGFKALQGVRLDVGTSLWKGKQCLAEAKGNLIFTPWGINGPAVMDLSHAVSLYPSAELTLSLNLLAFVEEEFEELLRNKRRSDLPARVFLGAFFIPKVVQLYLHLAKITPETRLNQLDGATLGKLTSILRNTCLEVKGVRGFEFCQVSAGGVPVTEVDPLTLASRKVPGLFLAGETLDVVGPCGGYNLQFAFSSGALAGRAAALEKKEIR